MDIWVDGKDAVVTEASVTPIRPVIPLAALAIWDPKPPTKLVRSERGHWTLHNRCHRCDNGSFTDNVCCMMCRTDGAPCLPPYAISGTETAVVGFRSLVCIGRDLPSSVQPPVDDRNSLIGCLTEKN